MSLSRFILTMAASASKGSVDSYIDLEMPVDDHTFVTKTGALVSFFDIGGLLNVPVESASQTAFLEIERLFSAVLKDKAHKLAWSYEQDPHRTEEQLEELVKRDRETMRRIGLDCQDVVDEIVEVNKADGLFQANYLAIYTDHRSESDIVVKSDREKKQKAYRDLGVTLGNSPNPFTLMPAILTKHATKIENICTVFEKAGYRFALQNCREACISIARMIDPKANDRNFNITLPYDTTSYKDGDNRSYLRRKRYPDSPLETLGDYTPDKLSKQLCAQRGTEVGDGILQIGSRYFAILNVYSFPRSDVTFAELYSEIGKDIPYRINFLLGHDSNSSFDMKKILGSLSRWGHEDNKAFMAAAKKRSDEKSKSNVSYCSLQIAMCTWADDLDLAIRYREQLLNAVQKWEGCKAKSEMGDPFETFCATIPGVTFKSPTTVGFPPVGAAVGMLPVTSEGRCWDYGSLLFRTFCTNVVVPFEPLAKNQDYSLDVILARPRQGKGILSNSIAFAMCAKPGNTELPFQTFVDVGPTSTGYGNFMRDSLPESLRDLIVMHKLRKDGEHINPCDIQFGLMAPLPEEKAFISNFLRMICTDPSTGQLPSNMEGMISAIIDHAYKYKFNEQTGNIYVPHINKELDETLASLEREGKLPFKLTDNVCYWELRDILFVCGHVKLAKYCHINAMPLLSDLREVANTSEAIDRDYGELPALGGVSLPKFFALKVKEAINNYPIFTRPTDKDFDTARIIIIDVKPMVDVSSDVGIVQTGIFMLLARFIGCKNYVLNKDHVSKFPHIYRDYQTKRIKSISSSSKRAIYDELHTSNKCQPFRDQLAFDVKEGPKWNTSICVISHEPKDFGPLLKQSTNLFVLGSLPRASIKELDEIIGLSPESKFVFNNNMLHGPRKGGSSFLLKTTLSSGSYEQVFRFPKGPRELWSYTTDKRDMPLRDNLIERIGTGASRRLLSMAFPGGSASKWFSIKEGQMSNSSALTEEERTGSLVESLEEELLEKYSASLLGER